MSVNKLKVGRIGKKLSEDETYCYSCGRIWLKDKIHDGVCRECWQVMSRIENRHRLRSELRVELLNTF